MSDSLWPHGLQHIRLLCLPLSSRIWSNSCPLTQWCYLTISFSAAPFSFCLQSFPASESFPMSQLFTSGGQSIGASASVLPMNIQGWFLLGLTGLISLLSKGLSSWIWPNKRFSDLPFNSKDGKKKMHAGRNKIYLPFKSWCIRWGFNHWVPTIFHTSL